MSINLIRLPISKRSRKNIDQNSAHSGQGCRDSRIYRKPNEDSQPESELDKKFVVTEIDDFYRTGEGMSSRIGENTSQPNRSKKRHLDRN